MTGSCRALSSSNHRAVSAWYSGALHRNASFSSSFFTSYMPRSLASGANTRSVSREIFTRFSGLSEPSVRMLCSRSASLTMITRTSVVMARNICCRSSAWTFAAAAFAASGVSSAPCLLTLEDTLLTLVSPSTMRRTAGPNRSSMDSKVTASVSSTVS